MLGNSRTAFTCTGNSLLDGTSLTWNPTVTVTLPRQAVAGVYTGTITRSVV